MISNVTKGKLFIKLVYTEESAVRSCVGPYLENAHSVRKQCTSLREATIILKAN